MDSIRDTWLRARLLRLARWPVATLTIVGIAFLSEFFNWRQNVLGHEPEGKVLDTRLWYTPADASAFLHAIGREGRQLYVVTQLTADFLFLALYGLLMAILLVRLLDRTWGLRMAILALAAAMADGVENLATSWLAATYDGQPSWVALVALGATLAKFGLTLVALVALLGGAAWRLARG